MHLSLKDIKTKNDLSSNFEYKKTIFELSIIYTILFLISYYDVSVNIRILLVGLTISYQFISIRHAISILVFAFFFRFFYDFIDISGIRFSRICFIPFLIKSINYKNVLREFSLKNKAFFVIFVSTLIIKVFSEFQLYLQFNPKIINSIASFYDYFVLFYFLIFLFKNLKIIEFDYLLRVLYLAAILQAFSIIFMVVDNPEVLLGKQSSRFLWNNPIFGQKNTWGVMYVFILTLSFFEIFIFKKKNIFYYVSLFSSILVIALSLSFQALGYSLVSLMIIILLSKNFKYLLFIGFLVGVIALFQPDFLMKRVESQGLDRIESIRDLQKKSSGKFSQESFEQITDNFSFLPRIFFEDYEYNHSEGFWNGILYQQGILGFSFYFYCLYFLYTRYRNFEYHFNDETVRNACFLGKVLILNILFTTITSRGTYFIHYDGYISSTGFFNIFTFLYIELLIYQSKKL